MSQRQSSYGASRGLAERLHDGPLRLVASVRRRLMELARDGVGDGSALPELAILAAEVEEELDKLGRILASPAGEDRDAALHADLAPRLGRLCREFGERSGIECRLAIDPAHARLPTLPSVITFRTIAELLSNVEKHSGARSVEVSSTLTDDGSIVFSVRDDGIGMAGTAIPPPPDDRGFGLWSIGQRVEEIGGRLEFANDDGLRVSVVLPAEVRGPSPASADSATGRA